MLPEMMMMMISQSYPQVRMQNVPLKNSSNMTFSSEDNIVGSLRTAKFTLHSEAFELRMYVHNVELF